MSKRLAILASWHAARRQADVRGAVTLNAASFAGFALEAAEGDLEFANEFVPKEIESFWSSVRAALDEVATEEGAPLRAVGGN